MTEAEARKVVEQEGFTVLAFVGEKGKYLCFICNGEHGETEVCVSRKGNVLVSPT